MSVAKIAHDVSENLMTSDPQNNAGPTLLEQMWRALDGAYFRYRSLKMQAPRNSAHATAWEGQNPSLNYARGRAVGLTEAIAILSQPVTIKEVQTECVRRFKAGPQPSDHTVT